MSDDPLIVAMVGGPGVGKSTTAAAVFARLKNEGVNCELVHEVAKDLTWEERHFALGHQALIIAKQLRNYDRLYGKVDCIVTDTSPLLAHVYAPSDMKARPQFLDYVTEDWRQRRTFDAILGRDPSRPYNTAGRRQSEQAAIELDRQINKLVPWPLNTWQVWVEKDSGKHVDIIVEQTCQRL